MIKSFIKVFLIFSILISFCGSAVKGGTDEYGSVRSEAGNTATGLDETGTDTSLSYPSAFHERNNNSDVMRRAMLGSPLALVPAKDRPNLARYLGISGLDENEFEEAAMRAVAARWFANQYRLPVDHVEANFEEVTTRFFGKPLSGHDAYMALRKIYQKDEETRPARERAKWLKDFILPIVALIAIVSIIFLLIKGILMAKAPAIRFFTRLKLYGESGIARLTGDEKTFRLIVCLLLFVILVVLIVLACLGAPP